MARYPEVVAALLGALTVIVFVAIFLFDPALADFLTREDGVVEWLQAGLFVLTAVFALRVAWTTWRAGGSPVIEVLVTALLVGLIIGETDLDRIVFGRKVIWTRFLIDGEVWLGWRILAAAAMTLPPAALALYALRRRRELVAGARRALTEPAGRVLIVGLMIFAVTEALERPLGRIPGLPRYLLEETLELVAAICLAVALVARASQARRRRAR